MKTGSWIIGLLLLVLTAFVWEKPDGGFGKGVNPVWNIKPGFLNADTRWVDSLMQTMSLEEKIGQLFMVAA